MIEPALRHPNSSKMCRILMLVLLLAVVANGLSQDVGAAAETVAAAAAAEQSVASSSAAWSTYRVVAALRHKKSYGDSSAVHHQQQQQQQQSQDGLRQLVQLALTSEAPIQLGPSVKNLTVQIISETESRLNVKIHPANEKPVEVLQSRVLPRPSDQTPPRTKQPLYQVLQPVVKPNRPFALTIARQPTLEPIFDTRGHRLLFKDKHMELTTTVPRGAVLYRIENLQQQQQQQQAQTAAQSLWQQQLLSNSSGYTLTPWERTSSSSRGSNSSSSSSSSTLAAPAAAAASPYLFHLQVNPNGQSHGVLLFSNNVSDIVLNQTALTYKLSGGIFDLYFFMGPSPEAVLRQYSRVVGSTMSPLHAVQLQLESSTDAAPAVPAAAAAAAPGNVTIPNPTTAAAATTLDHDSQSTNSTSAMNVVLPATANTPASFAAATNQNSSNSSNSAAATPAAAPQKVTNTQNLTQNLSTTAGNSTSSLAMNAIAALNATATATTAAAAALTPAELLPRQLRKYLDSSAYLASSNAGVLAMPLMVTHPADARARLATRQYMIGDGLLVSLTAAANNRSALNTSTSSSSSSDVPRTRPLPSSKPTRSYFTVGNWYSVQNFKRVKVTQGKMLTQQTSPGEAAVHFRGGSVIPLLLTSNVASQSSSQAAAAAAPAAAAAAPAAAAAATAPPVDGAVGPQSQSITLAIALPLAPASKRAILGQTDAGPLPPYALDKPCATAHWENPGRLISCGLLYAGNSSASDSTGTIQVWYKAVTAEGGRSGSITNFVTSKAKDTPSNKLEINDIKILGVPGTAADQPIVSVYKGGNAVRVEYDAEKEVLSIAGLALDAAAALNIDWRLRKQ